MLRGAVLGVSVRRRRPRLVLAVGVVAAGILGICGVCSAVASPIDPGLAAIRADLNEDEIIDLQLMADEAGISLDEAISTFGWQDSFAKLANELEDQYPDEYAGAEIVDAKGRAARIAFKGAVPPAADKKISAFVKGRVRVQAGKGFSVRELEDTLIVAFRSVNARKDVAKAASGEYDLETGIVQLQVEPTDALALLDVTRAAAVRRQLLDAIPAKARVAGRVDIQLRETSPVKPAVADAYGGGCVLVSGNTCDESASTPATHLCTGGFSVRNSAGDRRMMNAGHCFQTDLTWRNKSGWAPHDIHNGPEHIGDWGDLQYFNVYDAAELNIFYYSWSSTRYVLETRNAVVGQTICEFGRTTGASCSEVENTSGCYNYPPPYPDPCRLTRTDADTVNTGDSGGPWYYGNVAYGITAAEIPGGNSLFTAVRLSDEALNGAYVITS
jgi:streptogrisin C